ncbi:hypothetical protein BDB01DRAFT_87862 [Pilobolus umbonatus]|nr:hypothetical protein BDB01DRAFT_87862 [Pilobolus umbonatus]
MLDYSHPSAHPFNTACKYCHNGPLEHYTFGEDSEECVTTLDEYLLRVNEEPFHYNYLLNLMTTPNITDYLTAVDLTEDVYALPIHLQQLISEAKEEIVVSKLVDQQGMKTTDKPALSRLETLRDYVTTRSDGDISTVINILEEIIYDEDELADILRN